MSDLHINYFNSTVDQILQPAIRNLLFCSKQTKNDVNGSMHSILLETIHGLKHWCNFKFKPMVTEYYLPLFVLLSDLTWTAHCCVLS